MNKIQKGDTIKFLHISEFIGELVVLQGTVIGFGTEVRKMWPEEMGECPDDMMLVRRRDANGNTFHYAISPADVLDDVYYAIDAKGRK